MGTNFGVNRQILWPVLKETNSSMCVSCTVTDVQGYHLSCVLIKEWHRTRYGESSFRAHGPSHSFPWISKHCRFTPNSAPWWKIKGTVDQTALVYLRTLLKIVPDDMSREHSFADTTSFPFVNYSDNPDLATSEKIFVFLKGFHSE